MNANERPDDLISLKEATRLLPSPREGKRTHINTLRKHALTGRLRYWRNGPWFLVSRAEVLALCQAVPPATPDPSVPTAERAARDARNAEVLKRHRLRCPP